MKSIKYNITEAKSPSDDITIKKPPQTFQKILRWSESKISFDSEICWNYYFNINFMITLFS